MRKVIITEFWLAFLLGAVPMIVANTQPDFSAVKALASLNPGDPVVNYFLYLLGFHLVVWVINYGWLKTNDATSSFFNELHEFSHKLGFAIHGIYRVMAGAVPAAMYFVMNKHGLASGWQAVTLVSLIFSLASFSACVALAKTSDFTAPKKLAFKG